MEKNKKEVTRLLFNAQMSYSLITICANLLAVIGLYFLAIRLLTEKEKAYLNADGGQQILNYLSFLIPISCMIWYFFPTKKQIQSDDKKISDKGKAKIINAPVVVGSVSFLGWAFGIASANVSYFFSDFDIDFGFRLRQVFTSIFFANLCFVFSYYSIDYLNRIYFIPKLFPDENISEIPNTIRLSILPKFMIFYFAVAITPILSFINVFLVFIKSTELTNFLLYSFVITCLSILIGVFLTFLISNSFSKPILSMQKAARQIQNGNYNVQLKNVSNDELGSLEDAFDEMAKELKEKEFIKDTFGKLVDPSIRDFLLKGNLELGGQLVDATILFADIRGFTSISEKLAPDEVVKLLNLYFERVSEAITNEGGLLNKFVGDGVLAIFGAPVPKQNPSLSAVKAGLRIRETIQEMNQEAKSHNLPTISIGIGIHSGPVLAGNIGSKSRMEYTVIGDTVNTASRIESLCKEYGKNFLVTKSVKEQIESHFELNFLDSAKIRGKENLSEIYWL